MSASDEGHEDADLLAVADILSKPYRKYWAELGRFIHDFADVEARIHRLAIQCAGLGTPVGNAVFHGMRIDNGLSAINRILEAKGDNAAIKMLEETFRQLSAIAALRNNIVHYGATYTDFFDEEGDLVVSNYHFASTEDRLRKNTVSSRVIRQMTQDLSVITIRLIAFELRKKPEALATMRGLIETAERASWQYKPAPQSPPPKKRAPKRPPPTR